MKNPKLLVIGETNFIYSIILAQDRNCGYLLDLASENKIDVAIPEFSFFEVKGRIDEKFKRREDRLKETISFLNDLMRSEYHKDRLYDAKEKLKQLYMESSKEKRDVLESAEDIKSLCILIPHNVDIAYRAFIRDVANIPPFKNSDRQIYESVMVNTDNEVTYTLMRAAGYIKDNRLLPYGFNKRSASTDIKVYGHAEQDRNFKAGTDEITYRVNTDKSSGPYTVTARLLYTPVSFAFAKDLRRDEHLPLVKRFRHYYDKTDKSPVTVAVAQEIKK